MANFRKDSRYAIKEVETDRSGDRFIVLREALGLTAGDKDVYIQVDQEILQRPDIIAHRAYSNRELWWVIYEYNNISDPLFELRIGQILKIPSLSRVEEFLSKR